MRCHSAKRDATKLQHPHFRSKNLLIPQIEEISAAMIAGGGPLTMHENTGIENLHCLFHKSHSLLSGIKMRAARSSLLG